MSVDEALRAWNCEGVSVSTVGLEGAKREGFLLSYHKLPNLINLL